ncbi:sialate O-acetylesterase [Pontibacter akesuensis]|uniref:Sialate O-acetylesterase n=2 Tax=Pontibacter akesuensis TaxID=388950 RepID=A0A1I7FEZ2_9BACT|nr:9-O-acetylesterase [Pontibacter akesuensis]SFU34759.1 sialate O-acetylesterase [Pontibacter akesuensis]
MFLAGIGRKYGEGLTNIKPLQIRMLIHNSVSSPSIHFRMPTLRNAYLPLLLFFFLFAYKATSQVKLPQLVSDGMVLQRDAKTKIWGWASPSEKVTVKFKGKSYKATTGKNGEWEITLAPMKAGGPYTMDIKASNQITVKDILLGDVYLVSGQSNMVHQMSLHNITYAGDIATANYPHIRHFWIPTATNLQGPAEKLPESSWKSANPQDVANFSAVAYFFARKLHTKYKIPIGLINASVGGTPIEAWMSEEGLQDFPAAVATINKNSDTSYVNSLNRRALAAAQANKQKTEQDKGLTGEVKWYETTYKPKGWRTINIPGYWEDQGIKDLNGVVWYRREIDVPVSMTGVPAKVHLGRIVDADVLYINGQQVGNTTYQYPQRRYSLPAGVLKPGKNVFVIRVTNQGGKGGFVPDKPYFIEANEQTLDLKGYWDYKVGDVFRPASGSGYGGGLNAQNQPAALYNAMVAPVTDYTLKGILWYQGESNAGNPSEYKKLLPALISDWRSKWQQEKLPFLYVQLPNFMDVNYLPSESNWALMREAALQTLAVPNTAMAVTIELGEWNDIHPDNKKDVGERLALAAQRLIYGEKDVVSSGPLFQSAKIEGEKIILSFTNTGSGLTSIDGEELSWFAIAGADKKFVWAKAKIEGDKVVVWSEEVPEPRYVRYAWADNPAGANLYNKEGLPASPFRTDQSE